MECWLSECLLYAQPMEEALLDTQMYERSMLALVFLKLGLRGMRLNWMCFDGDAGNVDLL